MQEFEFGPLARGIYQALIYATLVVIIVAFRAAPLYAPGIILGYALLLLFLGIGLKPLLLKTGLHSLFEHAIETGGELRHRGRTEKRRREVDRQRRDEKYRKSRCRDPDLPPNW